MGVLIAAVVLVGVLCVLDLLLTLGVIRRLREHTTHLEGLLRAPRHGDGLPEIGNPVGEFTTTTVDGESVSQASLTGDTLVAFFSPGCEPCEAKLPDFLAYARNIPGGPRQVWAVVTGPADKVGEMVDKLRPVVTTVMDGVDGPVSTAFQTSATPTFCLVDDAGRIAAAEFDFTALPTPVRA